MIVPFCQTTQQRLHAKCRLPDKPRPQPPARGSLQLPRHTHTVPEHVKGEKPKLKAHFRSQLHLIRASRRHSPKQGAVFNCPGTLILFRSTIKGRCPRGVTPLGCSLVLSRSEKEQSTIPACFIRAAAIALPSTSTLPRHKDSASAEAAKGLSGRPLETFGSLRLEGKDNQPVQSVSSEQRQSPCHQHERCRSAGIPPLRRHQRAFRSPFGNLRFPPVGEQEQAAPPACTCFL